MRTDETVTRARSQALYLCLHPALVVFAVVIGASRSAGWAAFWTALVLAITVPVPIATLAKGRRARRSADVEAWSEVHGWSHVRASTVVPRSGRDVLRAMREGVEVVSYETIAAPDLVSESPLLTRHAVAATVPGDLPRLVVLPETLIREPGAARRARDIQFESAEFNARWRVHCDDDRFAHAFCHPRLMERLMRPDANGLSVLVEGRDVVVHAPGPQQLEALAARAALAVDLARLVPPYLLERYPQRTSRRRERRSEHSRMAAVLAVVLLCAWLALLALLVAGGAPVMLLGLGLPALVLLFAVAGPGLMRRKDR